MFEFRLFIPLKEFAFKFFSVKEQDEYIRFIDNSHSEKKIKDLQDEL